MNEALENAWKEFERTGEIANSADELLGYATRLTEENAKLRDALGNLVKESLSLADFKNKTLKRAICSTDLDEPEWHDYQTIAEADLLLNQLKDQNNDK